MSMPTWSSLVLGSLFLASALAAAEKPAAPAAGSATAPTFAAVQAILNQRCISCHGAEKAKGRLHLHNAAGIAKKVKPGAPDESKIYSLIVLPDDNDDRMPPAQGGKHQRVPDAEAAVIRAWIVAGAPGLKPIKD